MHRRLIPWSAVATIVLVGLLSAGSATAATGPKMRVAPGTGYPVDPICRAYKIHQAGTRITVTGTGWTAGQLVTVTTDYPTAATVGTASASSTGTWSVHFKVPTAPDHAYVNVRASDSKGEHASGFYWLLAYTCFHSARLPAWKWDAVGWDANSGLTLQFDGTQVASGTTGANGAMGAVSFRYTCPSGTSHNWLVTGTLTGIPGGGTGTASGTFSC